MGRGAPMNVEYANQLNRAETHQAWVVVNFQLIT